VNRVAASRLPKRVFLTRGVGVGREKLTSFELALRDAGISHVNLIRVSSIFLRGPVWSRGRRDFRSCAQAA